MMRLLLGTEDGSYSSGDYMVVRKVVVIVVAVFVMAMIVI